MLVHRRETVDRRHPHLELLAILVKFKTLVQFRYDKLQIMSVKIEAVGTLLAREVFLKYVYT